RAVDLLALDLGQRLFFGGRVAAAHFANRVLHVGQERIYVVIGIYADGLGATQRWRRLGVRGVGRGRFLAERLLDDSGWHLGDHPLRRGRRRRGRKARLGRATRRRRDVGGV